EALARFPSGPLFLARSADRTEVAPRAGALLRRRRQETGLDRAIDDLQDLQCLPARVLVDRDRLVRKAAGGGGVEEPPLEHFLPEPLLDRQAVEHRLQHLPAADDKIR